MITGSGPQDRDETLFDHKPFAVIADALTRRGVAVLRHDDRGFGQSTGDAASATSEDFAEDTRGAMAFLGGRRDIDPARIGLIGHSEGGVIAPLAPAREPGAAFLVLMAAPGVPGPEAMAAQRRAVGRAMGLNAEAIESHIALMGRFDLAMAGGPDLATARVEAGKIAAEAPSSLTRAQMQAFSTPWYRWFMRYDPAATLRRVRAPVLALNGQNDLQVAAGPNLAGLRAALQENPDATIVELPGLNHLFQTSATGDPRDYATIEETIAPAALDLMADWVTAHARAAPGSLR